MSNIPDADRLVAEAQRKRIEELALHQHKTIDGEYGCPGLTCPGVKSYIAFAELILSALQQAQALGRHAKPEAGPMRDTESASGVQALGSSGSPIRYCAACQQPFTGLPRCPMCDSPVVREQSQPRPEIETPAHEALNALLEASGVYMNESQYSQAVASLEKHLAPRERGK